MSVAGSPLTPQVLATLEQCLLMAADQGFPAPEALAAVRALAATAPPATQDPAVPREVDLAHVFLDHGWTNDYAAAAAERGSLASEHADEHTEGTSHIPFLVPHTHPAVTA